MHLRVTGGDAVWATIRGGPTEPYYPGDDGAIQIPLDLGMPTNATKQTVYHLKLTLLRWNVRRYELVGGIVVAVGLGGICGLQPSNKNTGAALWNRPTPPDRSKKAWPLVLLCKDDESLQWHAGDLRPSDTGKVAVVGWSVYSVWDVSAQYASVAQTIITDIATRASEHFRPNATKLSGTLDCRGFIRQSELRVDFPFAAFPGNCIEETECNRIPVRLWDKLVQLGASMCGLDVARLQDHVNEDDGTVKTRVGLNVLEALSTAVLGLSGAFVGYDNEQFDDTSVPWQKFGTNSDCEDFAIAALALYYWLGRRDCPFSTTASTWLGRTLATFIPRAFEYGKMCTGFVVPQVARPDIEVTSDALGGHGWLMLRRNPKVFAGYPTKWTLVECTAITLSYRPLSPYDPKKSVTAVCNEVFDGIITLMVPSRDLLSKPMSIGCATLLGLDNDMIPFKYKIVATMSDGKIEEAVCASGTNSVGVLMRDVMVGAFTPVPVASDKAMQLYDTHIRGFCYDTDFKNLAMPHSSRRIKQDGGYDNSQRLYGAVVYTASDVNDKMGGKFVVPASADMGTQTIHTSLGDLLIVGFTRLIVADGFPTPKSDDALAGAPSVLQPSKRVERRLRRRPHRALITTGARMPRFAVGE